MTPPKPKPRLSELLAASSKRARAAGPKQKAPHARATSQESKPPPGSPATSPRGAPNAPKVPGGKGRSPQATAETTIAAGAGGITAATPTTEQRPAPVVDTPAVTGGADVTPQPAMAPAAAPMFTQEQARKIMIRRFVTAYLRPENMFNGTAAYLAIHPGVAENTAASNAWKLLRNTEVRQELARQAKAIEQHADLDEAYIMAQYRAMAEANVFDYVDIDPTTGTVKFTRLSADLLTKEQQLAIRELKIDPETGKVANIKLTDRKGAVDMMARVRKLIGVEADESTAGLAEKITRRMQAASKRLGRTFDGKTGEELPA